MLTDYPDYQQYQQQYESNVKYEDEDERKYDPDTANGSSTRRFAAEDDEYEEGEAY